MIFENVLKNNGKSCIGFLSIASVALTQKSASSKEEKKLKKIWKADKHWWAQDMDMCFL